MDTGKPKAGMFGKKLGSSGTAIFSGQITNEEYNQQLVGHNAIRLYEIMRRSDPTVRAGLRMVKLPVREADWFVEAASNDETDEFAKELISDQLFNRINWNQFLTEVDTELDFGHSLIEKTFDLIEFQGKSAIGIKELGYRKQTTIFAWETEDGKPGITQQLPDGKTASIPREKLMYFVFDQEGDNYEGISLLRYPYKAWDFKQKMERINAVASEKLGVGVPVFTWPADAGEAEKAKAQEYARQFRANEEGYVGLPEGWTMEMLDMKSNSVKDILPSVEYYDKQILLSVLGQFLLLGMGASSSGSRATSEDHSRLFLKSEEALAKQIQHVIQKELIEPLCDLNFSNLPNGYPQLKFGNISEDNITDMANALSSLYGAGALTKDPEVENHLREKFGLPTIPEERMELLLEKQKKYDEEDPLDVQQPTDPKDQKTPDPKTDKQNQKDIETNASLIRAAHNAYDNLIGAVAEG